jgi:hypothetical protein
MLLDNIVYPDCLMTEGNGKQMTMMVTTFGIRADNGFAENIFRGIARLGADRLAC